MKVIHLISGGDTGGAKTHVHSLLAGLPPRAEVTMVCFIQGPFVEEAIALGIPTIVLEGHNIPRILRQLREIVKEGQFDIIHSHGARGNMMAALLARSVKLPTVATVHSDYRLDYLGRPLSRLTYGVINKLALRRLDWRIGVSDAMVDLLISRGFDPERLYAIYNGLDFNEPPPATTREEFFRQVGLHAGDDAVVVGIAARLNPVKDVATLIRAFAIAHGAFPALRLLIAGDGAEMNMLKDLARELDVEAEVCFAGWVANTDAFYHAIDINTLTSLSETFPYALTEGARAALPTVSSRVGGVPYLIDHGANGYLFPVGDQEALAEYLLILAQDPQLRKTMGQRLYEKAKREFSLEATLNRQVEIYETILRRKKTEQVVICGAYGKGNAGDDAILLAIITELRKLNPDLTFQVLSRNTQETRMKYRVNSIYTFNYFKIILAMGRAHLYINGGGSLMQDVTSWRSLWFYLSTLSIAKRLGCNVLMYGCGIGPIRSASNRRLAAKVIQKNVDAITLRDPDSQQELDSMGVTTPQITLSADPTVILSAASPEVVDGLMNSWELRPDGNYIAFILRPWPGFDEKLRVFVAAAEYAYRTYGLIPVFFPIEPRLDVSVARRVAAQLKVPCHVLSEPCTAHQALGVLSRMKVVVSMRLHGLIFSAGQGVPLVGIVYDQKVSSFLSYIGQDLYTDLWDLTPAGLIDHIDAAVARGSDPAALKKSVDRLRDAEAENSRVAQTFLDTE